MANTIDQLRDRVQSLIDRDDYNISNVIGSGSTNKIDESIRDAVKWFYRSDASRLPPFEHAITGTIASGTNRIAVPGDLRDLRRIVVDRDGRSTVLVRSSNNLIFTENSAYEIFLPETFDREGGVYYTQRVNADVNYTIYYYRSLENLFDITNENFTVTPDNYRAGNVTLISTGTTALYFPTGTTETQARTGIGQTTYTPTLAATSDNTVAFNFNGNRRVNWLLNECDDMLAYRAAFELALFYDIANENAIIWKERADSQRNELIKEVQRLESSGATPQVRRPGQYNIPRGYLTRGTFSG